MTLDKSINKLASKLVAASLALVTLVIYWQVQSHGFVNYDDNLYVTDNPQVKAGLTSASIQWAFTTGHSANWHPLTWLSHMVDVELFGLDAGRHHLMSVLFHLANTILLFYVLKRMTGALWQSAFVAALFALHPLHVESVSWTAERKDVLSTFFWILTMLAYIRYVEHLGTSRYFLVALSMALGLMAKPMLVTLPLVLLLLDYWPLGRLRLKQLEGGGKSKIRQTGMKTAQISMALRLVREKIPLFALVVISSIITYEVQQSAGAFKYSSPFPLSLRIGNALLSYLAYIGKTIWPTDLAVLYPHRGMSPRWEIVPLPGWEVAVAAIALVSISILVIVAARRHPYLPFGWFWYVVTLVPVIGIVQVGTQAMADRYTYVPLIGLFMVAAWGANASFRKLAYRKFALPALAVIVLGASSVTTWRQVGYWKNSITLFEQTVAVTKINPVAHYNLGYALHAEGRYDEAIPHFSEALRIAPTYTEARNMLVNALQVQGRAREAAEVQSDKGTVSPR